MTNIRKTLIPLIVVLFFCMNLINSFKHAFYVQIPQENIYSEEEAYLKIFIFKTLDNPSANGYFSQRSGSIETNSLTQYGILKTADEKEFYSEYLKSSSHDRAFKSYVMTANRINPSYKYYVVWSMGIDYYNVASFKLKYFNCREKAVDLQNLIGSQYSFFYDGDETGNKFDTSKFPSTTFTQRSYAGTTNFENIFMLGSTYQVISDGTLYQS